MNPSVPEIGDLWDAPYMAQRDPVPTHLQLAIRHAIARSGKTRDHFDTLMQKKTGKTGKPIYDIDRGKSKKPSMDTIRAMAEVFELPVDYFLEPSDTLPTRSASAGDGAIEIRQLDLSYAMGDGSDLEEYPEEIGVKFDLNFLRALTRTPPAGLIVARGNGDSMSPTLINEDMVLIDTSQRRLNMQDRIWACAVYGAGMIKRLRVVGDQRIEVLSDNPTVGNREVDADDLIIIGRVIWVGRRV